MGPHGRVSMRQLKKRQMVAEARREVLNLILRLILQLAELMMSSGFAFERRFLMSCFGCFVAPVRSHALITVDAVAVQIAMRERVH